MAVNSAIDVMWSFWVNLVRNVAKALCIIIACKLSTRADPQDREQWMGCGVALYVTEGICTM